MEPDEVLQGTVEKVVFLNEANGYTVARLKPDSPNELFAVARQRGLASAIARSLIDMDRTGCVTIVGNLLGVSEGEILRCIGRWVVNEKFGGQFAVEGYESVVPSTEDGLRKYLSSGLIPGIGKAFADRLVDRFGMATVDVIEREPERLRGVPGFGQKRIAALRKGWDEQRQVRRIMIFLHSYGIGTPLALKIFNRYGNDSVRVVQEDPYRLALEVSGIGFIRADRIAQSLGFAPDSMERAEAGIAYVLEQAAMGEGHCYLPLRQLVGKAAELLKVDRWIAVQALERLLETRLSILENIDHCAEVQIERGTEQPTHLARLVEEEEDDAPEHAVYLRSLLWAERDAAAKLIRMKSSPSSMPPVKTERAIRWVQETVGITLSEEQKNAFRLALKEKVLVITGGPGTGKTTLIHCISEVWQFKKVEFLLAAPTGRAAKRMSELTGEDAKTIHRLLEFSPKTGHFLRNEGNLLECDAIILDEGSMLDISLMNSLLRATPDEATLIIVGDVDQLPPVGAGSVLKDIIESHVIPSVKLTEIFRQAKKSRIVINAHRVNAGLPPDLGPPEASEATDFYFVECPTQAKVLSVVKTLVAERIPQKFGFDPIADVQVLSPMHKGLVGVENLNFELQELLNPSGDRIIFGGRSFRKNDKVMQVKNNYVKEVFNGDTGTIVEADETRGTLKVSFGERIVEYSRADVDELVLAYAASVHKAQGCEYPAVVIPLVTQHYMLLQRNLLYTAISRGKRLVVLVGSRAAIAIAVNNDRVMKRYTNLENRLRNLAVSS
jgi:exodeoxyribonuclease V alpha subunit